jgi:hypothetical protein
MRKARTLDIRFLLKKQSSITRALFERFQKCHGIKSLGSGTSLLSRQDFLRVQEHGIRLDESRAQCGGEIRLLSLPPPTDVGLVGGYWVIPISLAIGLVFWSPRIGPPSRGLPP